MATIEYFEHTTKIVRCGSGNTSAWAKYVRRYSCDAWTLVKRSHRL